MVTKRPVRVRMESILSLGLNLDEAQWLLDAATSHMNVVAGPFARQELLKQLWNAVNQMREIENG